VVVGFLFLEFVPIGWVVCGASILGGNLYVRDLQNHILSDVPFLFWMLLALLLMARRRRSEGDVPSLVLGVTIGIVAYAAFATRTAGISLVLSMIAVDALHRPHWRRSAVVPTGVFLALASAQAVFMEVVEVGYLDQLRPDLSTVFSNAAGYAQWASSFGDNGGWEALRKGLFVISATLASIGFVCSMRKRVNELETFCLAYLALILI
jgi:energy-converting hydrogenase Eha subunit A